MPGQRLSGIRGIHGIVRRGSGNARPIAEPDCVAGAHHDVIGAGAAQDGLVVVVAHRVAVGERFQIGRVAGLDVEKRHRSRSFADPAGRLRCAVGAGGNGALDPREKIGAAAGRIGWGRSRRGAVELLPHLEQAVDRARGVGVVRQERRMLNLGELEGAGRQGTRVLSVITDARVGNERAAGVAAAGLAGAAGEQILIKDRTARVRRGQRESVLDWHHRRNVGGRVCNWSPAG